MNFEYLECPIGTLRLVSDGKYLKRIEFEGQYMEQKEETHSWDPVLKLCATQLSEYFSGKRKCFELPLSAAGTPFQKSVWQALEEIPFGELRSYSDIAYRINRASAVRAVGAANGKNPLPIVVPCHRVIGSNGSLTGFAGGLATKEHLLRLEGAI
jgi:methylated-DNA-[protein]-cysteine S-methyltransferase